MSYPKEFLDYCVALSPKWTSLRKAVLYVLWQSQKPLKAYEILEFLSNAHSSIQAPSIYRALDYFVLSGLVHKIESIQSYTLCTKPNKDLSAELLMVCNNCRKVQEIYDFNVYSTLQELTKKIPFTLGKEGIELKGLCQLCAAL